ncbi:hypothetical protein BURMUCGD2M_6494 [Burkholderia multivorans CGD2M]|uniref:Uncharacterized protein n=1 Tax=Burkholderia multivorans CGD2 TaxID=513052 RepID=B9BP84_9BURK|nr:hypothetical protein BURMUCGD2_6504 [Burkholderia multivorans CGD2]EEE13773.1 hypothetical protein BURMUCGD2M_6494 [Burkholderia multivorans CGD2M]
MAHGTSMRTNRRLRMRRSASRRIADAGADSRASGNARRLHRAVCHNARQFPYISKSKYFD